MCVAIIAVLMSLLLPMLIHARAVGQTAVCAGNLRQMSVAWQSCIQDNKDRFPRYGQRPEWDYGGAVFVGREMRAALDLQRPLNRHFDIGPGGEGEAVEVFRCPSDRGVALRGSGARGLAGPSVLPGGTCFETFGNSYRANPLLLDSATAGISGDARGVALSDIHVDHSRLLLTGDPAWAYATAGGPDEAGLDASWHERRDHGNMLAVDGSIRFLNFAQTPRVEFVLSPRP